MDLFEAASQVSGVEPPKKPIEPEVLEDTPLAHKDPFDLERLQASLVPYREQVEELVVKAYDHQITNAETNEDAVKMGSQLSTLRKKIDASRKGVIAPYDTIVRGINKLVKEFRDPIIKATDNLKDKVGRYSREQAEIARRIAAKKAAEEAEANRIRMEKERAEAIERQRLADEEAARKQAELDAIAKKEGVESVKVEAEQVEIPELEETVVAEVKTGPTKTDFGTASTISKWTYDVEDINKVPDGYIIPTLNVDKVKEHIAQGCRKIPGLIIYEDTQVRFRTK